MKKIISIILVLTAILTLTAVPAMAEDAGEIEENGFVCERLRNGNLILVKYIGDASGKIVNIPSSVKGSHVERIASNAFDGCKASEITIPDIRKEEQPPSDAQHRSGDEKEDPYPPLKTAGIDTQAGLRCCQDDRNMYETLLQEYARGAASKKRDLQQCYVTRDWKNYAVYVHSLKSTSRMIGAAALSEMAAALEAAADEGEADFIHSRHDDVMKRYDSIVETIRRVTGMEDSHEQTPGMDDDILEFLPE